MTKENLIDTLRGQLATRDNQVVKALMTIYARQTHDEQTSETTRHHNLMGFTVQDAKICSSLAKAYKRYGKLTVKQLALLKRLMPKYARQIIDVSLASGKIQKIGRGNYTF